MFNKRTVIKTERLILRPFTTDDRDSIFNIMKEEEMFEYTPDKPWKTIEDADTFINLALWLYDSDHETFRHFFAITQKESGALIGYCGIGGIAYDRTENEIFYGIDRQYWGRGYATEVGKALLEYAFGNLKLSKLIGAVHVENTSSIRVLEKLGLKRAGLLKGLPEEFNHYNGEYLYTINRDEHILTNFQQKMNKISEGGLILKQMDGLKKNEKLI